MNIKVIYPLPAVARHYFFTCHLLINFSHLSSRRSVDRRFIIISDHLPSPSPATPGYPSQFFAHLLLFILAVSLALSSAAPSGCSQNRKRIQTWLESPTHQFHHGSRTRRHAARGTKIRPLPNHPNNCIDSL